MALSSIKKAQLSDRGLGRSLRNNVQKCSCPSGREDLARAARLGRQHTFISESIFSERRREFSEASSSAEWGLPIDKGR